MKEPNYVKLVEYVRNGLVEEVHFGLVIHMNKQGIIKKIGEDNGYKFYYRSCMKPLQASALVDLNLDILYGLTQEEIAVCCASHTGDKIHQKYIKSVLNKTGFTEQELLCPAHVPLSSEENTFLIKNNLPVQKIHNNCSGKHVLMLAICSKMGFSPKNYNDLNHPLSNFIINKVCELCEINRNDIVISQDGCTLPVIAATLEQLGRGFLNLFTNPKYEKITNVFLNNPVLIGGEGRLDTEIIKHTTNVIAKVGACGLCVIVDIKSQEAFIIKIAGADMEARKFTAFEILNQKHLIDEKNMPDKTIKTLNNSAVGIIRTCF